MVLREIATTDDPKASADISRMYCCGVAELYAVLDKPVSEIKKLLYAARHEIRAGIVLATTNPGQVATATNLKEAGFSEVRTQLNPRMGREFTLWMCDVSGIAPEKEHQPVGVGTQTKARGVDNGVWIP